jgi:hypothetical protein
MSVRYESEHHRHSSKCANLSNIMNDERPISISLECGGRREFISSDDPEFTIIRTAINEWMHASLEYYKAKDDQDRIDAVNQYLKDLNQGLRIVTNKEP